MLVKSNLLLYFPFQSSSAFTSVPISPRDGQHGWNGWPVLSRGIISRWVHACCVFWTFDTSWHLLHCVRARFIESSNLQLLVISCTRMALNYESMVEILESDLSSEVYEAVQYFLVVLFMMLYKVVLTSECVDKILKYNQSEMNNTFLWCCLKWITILFNLLSL